VSGRHPLQAGELSVLGERYHILSEIVEAGVQLLQLFRSGIFLARRSDGSSAHRAREVLAVMTMTMKERWVTVRHGGVDLEVHCSFPGLHSSTGPLAAVRYSYCRVCFSGTGLT
jgi:hypothetical protein